jgi:8-oxo-dGTP pyrophosphatase MutT (NUDIX family)
MALKTWVLLGSSVVATTRIFKLLQDRWVSPRTGEEHTFSSIESADFVNVLGITTDDQLLMIRQFRFGTREFTLEVAGGMVEPGEDHALTAVRELREETGYVGKTCQYLGYCEPNPAIFNNRAHMYLIEGCERDGSQVLDPGEDIEVLPMPVEQVLSQWRAGEIKHALVSVALARLYLLREARAAQRAV